jgi:putative SOS response-associated peptidase YedK
MCGRYLIITTPEAMRAFFRYLEQPNFPPRYNVAPTQPIPVVRLWEGARHFALVRWGLIPGWVKDPRGFSLIINARGDSVLDKPAFRNAMRYRRCLVPADGFYEWKAEGPRKRPFAIRPRARTPLAFAGLWEVWTGPNGEEVETAAIVTTAANRALRPLHDRVPVVLAPDTYDAWLDCRGVDAQSATALIAPPPEDFFEAYEISPAVNRTENDSADLLIPASELPRAPELEPKKHAPRPRRDPDGRQGSLF